MANSINTNAGALVALQNLNNTSRDLSITQNRVNTGQKVSSAKDNGAIFAIATNQRAEMGALATGAATTVATSGSATVRAGATAAIVDTALKAFTAELGALGTKSKSLERSLTFTSKMQDALEVGVGNLVDADLAKESARLTALQTKQQLGVQALSIANQSSSVLLGLFR
ncbi:MAG: hypothetical protein IE910_13615 [Brevundimonas sp.]|nr:hypothetical protein [Brevundimonas sp.]